MLLGRRSIYYGIMCAYISALPFSLSVSFYPILLIEQGFGSEAAGWLLGMRPLGAIGAGGGLERFVRRPGGDFPPPVLRPAACRARGAARPSSDTRGYRYFS